MNSTPAAIPARWLQAKMTLQMETVDSIESKLGYKLPADYRLFLDKSDTSKYEFKEYCRTTLSGYKTDGQIDRFISIDSFWEDNKYRRYLEEYQEDKEISENYFESKYLYHIAMCDSQAICMALNGLHKGKIFSADNGDFGILFQANTLEDFLESLYKTEDYSCRFEDIKNAVVTNDIELLQILIEEQDGDKILNHSSSFDRELYDLAFKLEDKNVLNFLISKGYKGYDRLNECKL